MTDKPDRKNSSAPDEPLKATDAIVDFLYQSSAAESLRLAHEAGDPFALFNAMMVFAATGVPLPQWAAQEFIRRWGMVLSGEALSLDEAFGRPYPTRTRKHSVQTTPLKWWVYARVKERHAAGESIDDELFHKVGQEAPEIKGKTKIKKCTQW